jgi:hypothetical protein
MVEHIPVIPHARREARAANRGKSRIAGIGGMGVALGITAAVVIAPMAQATAPATKLSPGGPVAAHHVSAVTAPAVEAELSVTVPTIIKNEPPPKPKAKPFKKTYQQKSESQVGGDGDKNCGDKSGGEWEGWKDKD